MTVTVTVTVMVMVRPFEKNLCLVHSVPRDEHRLWPWMLREVL